MSDLQPYIDAWISADPDSIAALVSPACVIAESYGPVYRGRDRVHQWASRWFASGGRIHRWHVSRQLTSGSTAVAEWIFECTWDGSRNSFEGASIATFATDGLLDTLREYQTTHPLYDWQGQWR